MKTNWLTSYTMDLSQKSDTVQQSLHRDMEMIDFRIIKEIKKRRISEKNKYF